MSKAEETTTETIQGRIQINPNCLPEFFFSKELDQNQLRSLKRADKIRPVGPRLYTSLTDRSPDEIVKTHIWEIVAKYAPGAILAGRTALKPAISDSKSIFIYGPKKRKFQLEGGIVIVEIEPVKITNMIPFCNGLFLPDTETALKENLKSTRQGKLAGPRFLTEEEYDSYLVHENIKHNNLLKTIQDPDLKKTLEKRLNNPNIYFDAMMIDTYQQLADNITKYPPAEFIGSNPDHDPEVFAFYEGYFSNFIEGTEWEIEEARDLIIGKKKVTDDDRVNDAYDVINMMKYLVDPEPLPASLKDYPEFCKKVHQRIFAHRSSVKPGKWKEINNRAGDHEFVNHQLVEKTLAKAFEIAEENNLRGFEKALFCSYAFVTVHPFVDGNGRVSRILLNSILEESGAQRIIIPSISRTNYIQSLKATGRYKTPDALSKNLEFLQLYSHKVDFSSYAKADADLEKTNGFSLLSDEELGIRLTLPS